VSGKIILVQISVSLGTRRGQFELGEDEEMEQTRSKRDI